jgi:hypothetical protein
MEVSGQLHAPAALPPGERAPGTHWIGGWVGPRAVLEAEEYQKICCQQGLLKERAVKTKTEMLIELCNRPTKYDMEGKEE